MKKLYFLLAFACLGHLSYSQMRIGILGGPHSASVKEENAIPGYSSRSGINLGIITEIPLSQNSRWYLHPGIMYMAKGRKFYMRNDTTTSVISDTISSSHNLSVNYIEIPFNITYKLPLSKKANLLLSAGPYLGLFYNGKQKFETRLYSAGSFKNDEVNLETGSEAGKVKTVDAGLNARAGFELGNVMITGFMSQGLTSFYTASYDASFKHSVKGISVGFWLNRVNQPKKAPAPVLRMPAALYSVPTIPMETEEKVVVSEPERLPQLFLDTIAKEVEERINFVAQNIFFTANSDRLTPESHAPLDEVVEILKNHPSYNLIVEGHSDSTGNPEVNRKLSFKRAESVKNYLITKGIEGQRLTTFGFGPDKPLASNDTAEGRAKNRRVELKLAQ
jgi:outer membrane protein OmpA-like peptidoglycan-associated protein